jgi:hypothetical protein
MWLMDLKQIQKGGIGETIKYQTTFVRTTTEPYSNPFNHVEYHDCSHKQGACGEFGSVRVVKN